MIEDNDDNTFFKSVMSDVKPLKTDKKVLLKTPKENSPGLEQRRRSAQAPRENAATGLSLDYITPVDPLAVLSFLRPGVQKGVFKKLRLGKYPIDARLDLHGLTVKEAHVAVLKFVKDCVNHDVRCALVTHGKGIDRKPQPAMLKSCIATWLPNLNQLLAFHTARKRHGGAGATYLLLRKSDKNRRTNWERHIGKRG